MSRASSSRSCNSRAAFAPLSAKSLPSRTKRSWSVRLSSASDWCSCAPGARGLHAPCESSLCPQG
eukprot:8333517-Pyramimonas_sp.AAC.1